MEQSEYIIRNQVYTREQIEKLSLEEWATNNITNMPRSLFKYFRNVIDIDTGRNYSLEALESNTVYLQSPNKFDDIYDCSIVFDEYEYSLARLQYYSILCGFDIKETDFSKYIYIFAQKIYEVITKLMAEGLELEKAMNHVFHIRGDGTSKDQTHIMFVLSMCLALRKNVGRENVWQIAFADALNSEINHIRKTLSENFRIACFSTSPYMIRMWASQYANNHEGFCIEYEIPEYSEEYVNLFHNLFPVIYSDIRTSVIGECLKYIEDRSGKELVENIYKYGILTKSTDWKDQDEWRLVSPGNMLADDNSCEFFKIKKVYLGNRMPKEERYKVIEICKRKGIEYVGIINMRDRYELTGCPNLCDKCYR